MSESTSLSRTYRGHRIRAHQLGDSWVGVIPAPDGAIVDTLEGASPQEVTVRAVGLVNARLARDARR